MSTKTLRTIRLTNAEFAALPAGTVLPDNYEIIITDPAAGSPDIYRGTGGVVSTAVTQSTSAAGGSAAGLRKVTLAGSGSKALDYVNHNGAEVHAEAGITECTMALASFQSSGATLTGYFYLFNYSGAVLPLKLGAGWSGGISEDGDATNDLSGAGTLVNLDHAKKALIIFDADGWVRATVLGVEVTQSELNIALSSKSDADSVLRIHSQVFSTSIILAHPVNFAATTANGTDGIYTVSASSEHSAPYLGWKSFDGIDTTDWATNSVISNFWIRLQFPVKKIITRVVVRGRNSGTERITAWRIEASNDLVEWTMLHTSTDVLGSTAQTFNFTNKTAYLYYRFFALTGEATNPGLSRLEFHEDVPAIAVASVSIAGLMSATDKSKLDGVASGAEVNVQSDWTASSGDAQILNKPTLGTAAALSVPASGNAASSEIVKGNDTRLSDARIPSTHTHAQSDVTNLSTDLASKQAILSAAQIDSLNKIQATATRTIPTFTAATATGTLGTYTITRSTAFSATYEAWKACQASDTGGADNEWATLGQLTNLWIAIQLPVAKVITSIRVRGRTGVEHPQIGWRLEGSNDSSAWTTLYTSATAMDTTLQTHAINNTTAYLYYRMFSPTGSGSNPGMRAFWLYENAYNFPSVAV